MLAQVCCPPTTRPFLEALEDRLCPTPAITMTVNYGANHNVTFFGRVVDPTASAANLTVNLSGVVNGSTMTNLGGSFAFSGTASSLGTVTASCTDANGDTGTRDLMLANAAPVIQNFNASMSGGDIWTFTGNVIDEHPEGLVIDFSQSGVAALRNETVPVMVQADGTFSLTIQLNGRADDGTAVARIVSDWWGASSDQAWADVSHLV
jgi:hypothetical protein